ncbi:MAG: peptidyl-prolyl cis-trans isomerase [Gammaproteobacteria bacterium]|nr:peptidyl-prolyl cis-trans isomerase [Gammaproteobacteria bacterium]
MHTHSRNRIAPRRLLGRTTRSLVFAITATVALLAHPAVHAAEPSSLVKVSTSMGDFIIEVLPDRAPLTAANFLRYVKEGYYSGTLIHRVVANFVIQGGGHDATDYKLKSVHDPVFNESGNGLQNKRSMVGLARGDGAHSGNAQIYVNLVDNPDLDPLPTRWGYAVFGRVVQGMDVVDRIGVTATGAFGPFKADAPLKPVIIQKIEVVDAAAAQATAPPPAAPTRAPSSDAILSPK